LPLDSFRFILRIIALIENSHRSKENKGCNASQGSLKRPITGPLVPRQRVSSGFTNSYINNCDPDVRLFEVRGELLKDGHCVY
jgi:hypothetical protein